MAPTRAPMIALPRFRMADWSAGVCDLIEFAIPLIILIVIVMAASTTLTVLDVIALMNATISLTAAFAIAGIFAVTAFSMLMSSWIIVLANFGAYDASLCSILRMMSRNVVMIFGPSLVIRPRMVVRIAWMALPMAGIALAIPSAIEVIILANAPTRADAPFPIATANATMPWPIAASVAGMRLRTLLTNARIATPDAVTATARAVRPTAKSAT